VDWCTAIVPRLLDENAPVLWGPGQHAANLAMTQAYARAPGSPLASQPAQKQVTYREHMARRLGSAALSIMEVKSMCGSDGRQGAPADGV